MNDTIEKEQGTRSRWHPFGKVIFFIGLTFLILGILSSLVISYLAGTGVIATNPNYQFLNYIGITGIILTIIGVLVRYSSTTFSKDGIWSLQTGPYVK